MRKAFTLTEVLIVIGIVALLSGLLFTVTQGVREKGRETVCASNLKNIFEGASLYANDYPSPELPGGLDNVIGFPTPGVILPYVGSHNVFYCPNSTARMKSIYWSTYNINSFPTQPVGDTPFETQYHTWLSHQFVTEGSQAVFVKCIIHDLTYYDPGQNSEEDPLIGAGVFEIRLHLDGSVKTGWFPDKRGNVFSDGL